MQSCISEAQKYQGALYRPEKEKKNNRQNQSKALVPQKAYVEEEREDQNNQLAIVEPPMPEAPSPPSAAPGFTHQPVNVFDFLVESETPNASTFDLPAPEPMAMIEDVPETNGHRVRFDDENHNMAELVEYGNGPVPTAEFHTPAPKHERERERSERRKSKDKEEKKKDKKRKRLHVDTHSVSPKGDEIMTDAPPVLHSGLTGGLNRLLRPDVFPPSPDYSGDAHVDSPGSPLKKTKHSKKRGRGDTISNIMSMINPLSSREHSQDRPRKHRQSRHRDESSRSDRKMIEYKPMGEERDGQMVVYQPRAELLLSFINKGPDSERGVSMNKALKRYHRERVASGASLGRADEEKELWRSLRMKQNERGEIVLFM
ncbi:hypothetical protein BP6252_10336 [Coleophoma cylindrospora]|uniref:LYAR-type C2HC zinc finger n=1 Tax=Coleophoma cylindrospora TaxID=1849047 RepID=A0A3D8QSA6_9HELO|nr:hypothetical protein BP6252_10336 [Coleophoma cylindrospora]